MLVHSGGVVLFPIGHGDGLRRSGLAATEIPRTGEHPCRGSLLGDTYHGTTDDLHMFWLEAEVHGWLCCNRGTHPGCCVLGGDHQLGFVLYPGVGHGSCCLRQLEHREAVVALSDSQGYGFAGIPLLLLRALVVVALPCLAGEHTADLAVDVDPRNLPKAHRLHEVVHRVHAQFIGQ